MSIRLCSLFQKLNFLIKEFRGIINKRSIIVLEAEYLYLIGWNEFAECSAINTNKSRNHVIVITETKLTNEENISNMSKTGRIT